jgi:hypothetical protein
MQIVEADQYTTIHTDTQNIVPVENSVILVLTEEELDDIRMALTAEINQNYHNRTVAELMRMQDLLNGISNL